MFFSGDQYRQHVEEIVAANTVDLAVAFLGEGASNLIGSAKRARVICNLESGATNPHVVKDLLDKPGVDIRSLATLHAKVIIAEHVALVGSANLSANGLGLQGAETARWEEAGTLVRDLKALADARAWFSGLWDRAAEIGPEQLKIAELAWKRRRSVRPPSNEFFQKGLFARILEDEEFPKDRPLYVVAYRRGLSTEATNALQRWKKSQSTDSNTTIDCYEDWDDLP